MSTRTLAFSTVSVLKLQYGTTVLYNDPHHVPHTAFPIRQLLAEFWSCQQPDDQPCQGQFLLLLPTHYSTIFKGDELTNLEDIDISDLLNASDFEY